MTRKELSVLCVERLTIEEIERAVLGALHARKAQRAQ